MKLSPSIDVVWRLAANEMAAGEFREIAPEHFCMALLKFAELSAEAADKAEGWPADVEGVISEDAQLLREALRKCGIDSTTCRRKLRGHTGKGGSPYQGGPIHRSTASRALFELAIKLAEEAGSEAVTPLHVLTAMVQSPTPAMAQAVLGKAPSSPLPAPLPPLLQEHGQDLVKVAAVTKLNPVRSDIEVQCKVLIRALQHWERKSILLVSDSDADVFDLLLTLAGAIGANNAPDELKKKRLIDVAQSDRSNSLLGILRSGVTEKQQLERMRQLLAEAADHPELILVVPAVEAEPKQQVRGGAWTCLVTEMLMKQTVQFICRMAPPVVREHLYSSNAWRRHAQMIWLERVGQESAPREL